MAISNGPGVGGEPATPVVQRRDRENESRTPNARKTGLRSSTALLPEPANQPNERGNIYEIWQKRKDHYDGYDG